MPISLKAMHECRNLWPGQIRTHALAHTRIHRAKIVNAMSRFTASGLDKNDTAGSPESGSIRIKKETSQNSATKVSRKLSVLYNR